MYLVFISRCIAAGSVAALRKEYSTGFGADDVKNPSASGTPLANKLNLTSGEEHVATGTPRLSNVTGLKPIHSTHHGIRLALIIDDDEVARVVVAQCLEPMGYKVSRFAPAS